MQRSTSLAAPTLSTSASRAALSRDNTRKKDRKEWREQTDRPTHCFVPLGVCTHTYIYVIVSAHIGDRLFGVARYPGLVDRPGSREFGLPYGVQKTFAIIAVVSLYLTRARFACLSSRFYHAGYNAATAAYNGHDGDTTTRLTVNPRFSKQSRTCGGTL